MSVQILSIFTTDHFLPLKYNKFKRKPLLFRWIKTMLGIYSKQTLISASQLRAQKMLESIMKEPIVPYVE